MGTYATKISQAGIDVKNAADEELDLHPNFPIFKVFQEGDETLSLPSGNSSVSVIVTHNLGYKSIVLVYAVREEGVARRDLITGKSPFSETFDQVELGVVITDNSFTVDLTLAGPAFGDNREYDFHYYVMYEDMS